MLLVGSRRWSHGPPQRSTTVAGRGAACCAGSPRPDLRRCHGPCPHPRSRRRGRLVGHFRAERRRGGWWHGANCQMVHRPISRRAGPMPRIPANVGGMLGAIQRRPLTRRICARCPRCRGKHWGDRAIVPRWIPVYRTGRSTSERSTRGWPRRLRCAEQEGECCFAIARYRRCSSSW
jgi:hypothetical protein